MTLRCSVLYVCRAPLPYVKAMPPSAAIYLCPTSAEATCGTMAITDHNRHLLRSGYARRRPEELPVLSRYSRCWHC